MGGQGLLGGPGPGALGRAGAARRAGRGTGLVEIAARRAGESVAVLVTASVVVFVLVAESGDPLASLRASPGASKGAIEARARLLHLHLPLWERYWIWISHAVRGDFGDSLSGAPVGPELVSHLEVSLRLVLAALVVALAAGIGAGVFAGLRSGRTSGRITMTVTFLVVSMPTFVLGVVLKAFVATPINEAAGETVLYTSGERSPTIAPGLLAHLGDAASHAVLPVLTLALSLAGTWTLYQRAAVIEARSAGHVTAARAIGLPAATVVWRHVVRNALVPLTTVVALDFAAVIGGAIVTEEVFNWPGMGTWFVSGVEALDVNVVLAFLVVTAAFVVAANLLADLVYAALDPRVRDG